MSRYWHGGTPGLKPGDAILPPDETGTEHRLSRYVPDAAPHGTRTDRVYLSRTRTAARTYAALYPDGALYEVTVSEPTEPDPDAPDDAVMTSIAHVRSVVDPVVLFRDKPLHRWLNALAKSADR